jgi:hypothetical protein
VKISNPFLHSKKPVEIVKNRNMAEIASILPNHKLLMDNNINNSKSCLKTVK